MSYFKKILCQGTFKEQAEKMGLSLEALKFSSPCEVCVGLYSSVNQTIPALNVLADQKQTVQYYPLGKRLPPVFESILDSKFHVKYFCTAALSAQNKWRQHLAPQPPYILTKSIQEISEAEFGDFTLRTYYSQFTAHQDENDRAQFLETIPRYFKEKIFGRGYYVDGKLAAVIITHLYAKHPATDTSTLHIGYWGYDHGLLQREGAEWVKNDWFALLRQWSADLGRIPIDASIDWFKEPAFKMAFSRGFQNICLRLDKRCLVP